MDYKAEYEIQRRIVRALGNYIPNSETTLPACKFCGSTNVVRNRHRKGTQYWLCKHCGHGFVAKPGNNGDGSSLMLIVVLTHSYGTNVRIFIIDIYYEVAADTICLKSDLGPSLSLD